MSRANVHSIPASEPFLETLLDGLLGQRILPGYPDPDDPLALASLTILLPTRRACRLLGELFAARFGNGLILPRIKAIGDIDEDDILFADPDAALDGDALHLPATVSGLTRRLVLARLILAFTRQLSAASPQAGIPSSAADAVYLAAELARLMDMVTTESMTFDALADILPDGLQAHWQVTLDFLKIATQTWPQYLGERGLIEPATRRRLLLEAEAATLSRLPPAPVIAAGSTGSIPATANLLKVVAHLPRGAVVLPGLDRTMDDASWLHIAGQPDEGIAPEPSHPQFGLRNLLTRLGVHKADDVPVLTRKPDAAVPPREAWLSHAMRPAATTDHWTTLARDPQLVDTALDGMAIIEAMSEHEEALAIACLLRETIETDGKSAALITPDRVLARRVAAELGRFGLEVDDSAGIPLVSSFAGLLAQLAARCAGDALEPASLLALLKHPLALFGRMPDEAARAAQALERLALRGPAPDQGSDALIAAVKAGPAPRHTASRGLDDDDRAAALALAGQIGAAFTPLEALHDGAGHGLDRFVQALHQALALIMARPGTAADTPDDSIAALDEFLTELATDEATGLVIEGHEFADMLQALMQGRQLRNPKRNDPRIRIYGLLEARLVRHDRVVLGGLNEGVWPATTRTDPWLSRTMRRDMGLPVPEKRIGLAAHDFAQALGTHDAWITRSLRTGGAPTVASRWLQRLAAVIGRGAYGALTRRGNAFLALARTLDPAPRSASPVPRPRPCPPVSLRPRRLSVTEVETLVRDPYSIFAKHILKLQPFEEIAEEATAATRGTLVHEALKRFALAIDAGAAPEEALLLRIGNELLDEMVLPPGLRPFWQARLARISAPMAQFERERRMAGHRVIVERSGRLVFAAPYGPFELTARADRLEQTPDGGLCVIDFKTGAPPGIDEVLVGFAPQLPLEAAMVLHGGFAEAGLSPHLTMRELLYIQLSGSEAPVSFRTIAHKNDDPPLEDFVRDTYTRFTRLICAFDAPDMPYRSLQHPQYALKYGKYDHLARVREWGLNTGEGGEE